MRCRPRWAAAVLAAGAATVIAAAPVPAASGWRIERVFGRANPLELQAVAASGAGNAWLLGLVPLPEPVFVTQRWDGSRWVPVALPARLRHVIGPWWLYSGIYTTSRTNTWFFPVLPDHHMTPVQYALRWTGSAWVTSQVTTRRATVLDAAVFSASDVWAFAEAGASFPRYGPAIVRHWNGRVWRTMQVPVGTPVTIDPAGPRDIWALGVSQATIHHVHQAMIAMHWNGTAWSAPRLPTIPPVKRGYPWTATAIWAAGPRDAWVTETPATSQQTGFSPPGLILLHWNGSTWRKVATSNTLHSVTGLTPDGHGGFWLTATSPGSPQTGDIIDYRHGTFTSQPAPAPPGYTGTASGIVAVPGTGSFWATGVLTPVKNGNAETDILHYTR